MYFPYKGFGIIIFFKKTILPYFIIMLPCKGHKNWGWGTGGTPKFRKVKNLFQEKSITSQCLFMLFRCHVPPHILQLPSVLIYQDKCTGEFEHVLFVLEQMLLLKRGGQTETPRQILLLETEGQMGTPLVLTSPPCLKLNSYHGHHKSQHFNDQNQFEHPVYTTLPGPNNF